MYNWIGEFSGACQYRTEIIDLSKNINIKSFTYDDSNCEMNEKSCNNMYINYNQSIKKFGLTPISNLKMNFLESKNGIIVLRDMVFKIERNKNIAQLVVLKNGQKHIIKQQILESHFNDEYQIVCENDLLLNGCFLNPLNKNQIVFHMYHAYPCGFEGETDYLSNFASYILSD